MENALVELTVKWAYPYNEAVGAKETQEMFYGPVTIREIVEALVQKYPALDACTEKNTDQEHNTLVCIGNKAVDMLDVVETTCELAMFAPLSGG